LSLWLGERYLQVVVVVLVRSTCPEWRRPIPQVLEPAVCGLPWVSAGGNLPEGVV
jgi:hypothetical protein